VSSSSTTDEYVGEESKGHDDEEAYANRHEHLPEHRLERLEHRLELLGAVVDDGDESLGDDDECVGHIAIPMTMTASMYSNAIMIPSPTTPLRNGKR